MVTTPSRSTIYAMLKMSTLFKNTVTLLADEGELNDLELLMFFNGTKQESKNAKVLFDFEKCSEDDCIVFFRFCKEDILLLYACLDIPDKFTGPNGTVATGLYGLLILLKRLAYPARLKDIGDFFGKSSSEICIIYNEVLNHIYNSFGHLLTTFNQVS